MAANRGKQFEDKIKKQLLEYKNIIVERLPDQVSGFKNSNNPADFIVYKYPKCYYIECKSIHGASIPLYNLKQLNELLKREEIYGVDAIFIIWFVDKNYTFWVPASSIIKIKNKYPEVKSINYSILLKEANDGNTYLIPGEYKRVFGKYDFSEIFGEK